MNVELKSCPFCGGMPSLESYYDRDGDVRIYARCTNCGCSTSHIKVPESEVAPLENMLETMNEINALWNRRD